MGSKTGQQGMLGMLGYSQQKMAATWRAEKWAASSIKRDKLRGLGRRHNDVDNIYTSPARMHIYYV
jgi:hypothetical protein